MNYETEILDEDDDNGTMPDNVEALRNEVVGHRIVKAEKMTFPDYWGDEVEVFSITLDNGKTVKLSDGGDCCAYTGLESFLLNVENIEHVITGIGTTEGYTKWHIYADFGDVLELRVGWSCGNPFYYGYGFDIQVSEA